MEDVDVTAVSLREQFHVLEEQQKQRFQQRKAEQRATLGVLTPEPEAERPRPSQTLLTADDDLQLQTISSVNNAKDNNDTSGGWKTDGEIQFLSSEVHRLQLDNARLKQELRNKGHELAKLQALNEEEKLAFGGANSTVTQRIVELSKRNREITAELTSERNRVRQLQRKVKELSDLEQRLKSDGKEKEKNSEFVESEPSVVAKLEQQLLQEKQKTTEYRNQCQILKQDLKLAHRVLAKEVGDGVSVSSLLGGVSGWKGRAQQIIALQNKVTELVHTSSRNSTKPEKVAPSKDRIEARQKATLEKMEKERAKNLEETRLELDNVRAEYTKVVQQCSALKARNTLLSTNIKSLKSQLEGGACEVGNATPGHQRTQLASRKSVKLREESDQLKQDNDRLQSQLSKCRAKIRTLKEANRSLVNECGSRSSERNYSQSNSSSVSLPPIVGPPSPKFPPTTRKDLSLLRSLTAGRSSFNPMPPELDPLTQVSKLETEKLMELNSALQQRLDASTNRMMRMEVDSRQQREQITRLEKQLVKRQPRQNGTLQPSGLNPPPDSQVEDQLALQLNEIAVLRETLELTRQEKMEDIRALHSMLLEAKQLFVDSVRRMQGK